MKASVKMVSVRLDSKLVDEAVKALGAKNRSEAVHIALREIVNLKETATVRSDTALMREIRKGAKDLKHKKARLYTLEKLFS